MKLRFSHYLYVTALVLCLALSTVNAQTIPAGIGGLVIESSSSNPLPGQEITITVRSYSIDINAATISWVVDGKNIQSGIGMTTLKVVAPTLGKTISISVTAQASNGARVSDSYIVSSGSVDMIIESDGYVHPAFEGKLAPAFQNTLKIIAIPHIGSASGAEYDPKTLVYEWKKNDKVLQDQSGYGRQAIYLTGDLVPRPYEVTVKATPRTGAGEARGSAYITVGSPSIDFYVDDPQYGPLFNKSAGTKVRIGSENETSVVAVPYGFNKPVGSAGNLVFTWLINNIKRAELSVNESVVLRAPEGSSGSSNIRLDIRNTDKILQGASSGFSASFIGSTRKIDNDISF
jgi:hypothetical protein